MTLATHRRNDPARISTIQLTAYPLADCSDSRKAVAKCRCCATGIPKCVGNARPARLSQRVHPHLPCADIELISNARILRNPQMTIRIDHAGLVPGSAQSAARAISIRSHSSASLAVLSSSRSRAKLGASGGRTGRRDAQRYRSHRLETEPCRCVENEAPRCDTCRAHLRD